MVFIMWINSGQKLLVLTVTQKTHRYKLKTTFSILNNVPRARHGTSYVPKKGISLLLHYARILTKPAQ